MINIGIIAAISKEIKMLNKKLKLEKIKKKNIYKINLGKYKKFNLISLESGVGKVSSAIAATFLIEKFFPKFIINIGTTGSLSKKLNIGDIVISKKNTYHDVNLTTFGYKYGQIPKNPKYFLSNEKLIKIAKKSSEKINIKKKIGEIVTGDCFVDNTKKKRIIKTLFPKSIAVDMESTSIAQVCYTFNIPFISIRVVSDLSNKESKKSFKNTKNYNFNQITLLIKKILKDY